MNNLIVNALADNTRRSYSTGEKHFILFLLLFSSYLPLPPLPATHSTLLLFVTYLSTTYPHSTIKNYLYGVRHLHIINGWPNPVETTPRLRLLLRGIKRSSVSTLRHKQPMTLEVLISILNTLNLSKSDHALLWASCCLAFWAFLRCSEFTTSTTRNFDSSSHLTIDSLTFSNDKSATIFLKQSKTDPFRRGVSIFLPCLCPKPWCAPCSIRFYLMIRPRLQNMQNLSSPLFLLQSGSPLDRTTFINKLRYHLRLAKINPDNYTGHSFRVGAATRAQQTGIPDSIIQVLGRWASNCFTIYCKTSTKTISTIIRQMSDL
eukprot:Lithocolla_globosa_v1_NODE_1862_length_2289_cov_60.952551.p1 type:complete len:318 gc:universal NODE_1862_length_2289_cov_60.952551:799-1752(+)